MPGFGCEIAEAVVLSCAAFPVFENLLAELLIVVGCVSSPERGDLWHLRRSSQTL